MVILYRQTQKLQVCRAKERIRPTQKQVGSAANITAKLQTLYLRAGSTFEP